MADIPRPLSESLAPYPMWGSQEAGSGGWLDVTASSQRAWDLGPFLQKKKKGIWALEGETAEPGPEEWRFLFCPRRDLTRGLPPDSLQLGVLPSGGARGLRRCHLE